MIKLSLFVALSILGLALGTPLDDYVNRPDPHYQYSVIQTYKLTNSMTYVLNMTSQKWYDETVLNKPIWWHYLVINVPDQVVIKDAAFLFISSGNTDNEIPTPQDDFVEIHSNLAVGTKAVTAVLRQIPNQPLIFTKDPSQMHREEDEAIAWTWKEFLEDTSDPYILLRMPMTKAVVRAMDTVQNFTSQLAFANIKKFMVGGASKRGWTTWMTAAVDSRVVAAVPIVMDLVNINRNMHLHYRSLGGWTGEFADYYAVNVTRFLDTPEMYEMQKIIDPMTYFERYADKNIMVVSSSNDEFFIPDDTWNFWKELEVMTEGSALLKRIPNCDHSYDNHKIALYSTIQTFFLNLFAAKPQKLPKLTWGFDNNATHGVIRCVVSVESGVPFPSTARAYHAETLIKNRRDFRLFIQDQQTGEYHMNPVVWVADEKNVVAEGSGSSITYTYAIERPAADDVWRGFFLEFAFGYPDKNYLIVTTETNIVPEWYPYPDCTRDACYGKLV